MLHLSRFSQTPAESFNIPFDLTQDGIASVLGISRAHASLELKKLKELGKIDDWRGRVRGTGNKRIVYYLLPDGVRDADLLRKRFEESGIMVEALLDMKKCDPGVMWGSLSAKDKETFGRACVFRIFIPREKLPDTTTGVIPVNQDGEISINSDVREKYLSLAAPDDIKFWHSQAADHFIETDEDQERLYHLMKAGRNTEACKFLIKNSETFLFNPTDDLLDTVKSLAVIPKHAESVYKLRATVALGCEDLDDALACADILADYLTDDADLVRAEAYMLSGDMEKGLELAKTIFDDSPSTMSALIAARCLFRMKKYDEADDQLDRSINELRKHNDASSIDDMLILKAGIAYNRGKIEEALSNLSKAEKVSRKDTTKEKISFYAGSIKEGQKVIFY